MWRTTKDLSSNQIYSNRRKRKIDKGKVRQIGKVGEVETLVSWSSGFKNWGSWCKRTENLKLLQLTPLYPPPRVYNRHLAVFALLPMYPSVPSKNEVILFANGFAGGSDGRESPCNARDLGSIPGLGRSCGGGHGNPLQHVCVLSLLSYVRLLTTLWTIESV